MGIQTGEEFRIKPADIDLVVCRRGDIFFVDLGEIESSGLLAGIHPCVVLSLDDLNATRKFAVVVPLTSQKPKNPKRHHIILFEDAFENEPGKLAMSPGTALTDQVKAVPYLWLTGVSRVAKLTKRALAEVEAGVGYALDIAPGR